MLRLPLVPFSNVKLTANNSRRTTNLKQRPTQQQPTNHLDSTNVKWLQEWLVAQKGVTAVTVSHDSGFLDAVCTGERGNGREGEGGRDRDRNKQ